MRIATLITTNGRFEYLAQTLASCHEHVTAPGPLIILDDSGSLDYGSAVEALCKYRGYDAHLLYPGHQWEPVGQAKALAYAWQFLSSSHALLEDVTHVFHLEDDFTFNRPVDMKVLATVLDEQPHLQQIALLRQPWFKSERRAGGILQMDNDAYEPKTDGTHHWLEHQLWFTLNPCIYRRSLCSTERPTGRKHEWAFSRRLLKADPSYRYAYWGKGEEWVTHIGHERVGTHG